jgi:hypothetical protein
VSLITSTALALLRNAGPILVLALTILTGILVGIREMLLVIGITLFWTGAVVGLFYLYVLGRR